MTEVEGMNFDQCQSWGRFPHSVQDVHRLQRSRETLLPLTSQTVLPYGQGRSYGDVCLNDGGMVLVTAEFNRLGEFDHQTGVLRCEAGATLQEILNETIPCGWFLPVVPGTKFVSLGGAIANDIHGKNHHRAGTFGRHLRCFELVRSDGTHFICSPTENSELFEATIAGLGLTGVITWAELQLKPVQSCAIEMESIKFGGLDEFFSISRESEQPFEYTVAWIDCVSRSKAFGRGLFMRGNHSGTSLSIISKKQPMAAKVPFDLPSWALNRVTVKAFNAAYYHRQLSKRRRTLVHYDPFFFPLDAVRHWNRIYGRRGFFQFQCVVPTSQDCAALDEILRIVVKSGQASFLAVLKEFGALQSPGILSFPRRGVTLCLDFPNRGLITLDLIASLDRVVRSAGGAVYPAKDACMSSASFKVYFPRWREFAAHIDPAFSSSFWRRVTTE